MKIKKFTFTILTIILFAVITNINSYAQDKWSCDEIIAPAVLKLTGQDFGQQLKVTVKIKNTGEVETTGDKVEVTVLILGISINIGVTKKFNPPKIAPGETYSKVITINLKGKAERDKITIEASGKNMNKISKDVDIEK